jgi:hypothetical protein
MLLFVLPSFMFSTCTWLTIFPSAGMGASKKWKWTVHVLAADNSQTIGEWLTQHNLDGLGRGSR